MDDRQIAGSRKRFVGEATGVTEASKRVMGTAVISLWGWVSVVM